MVGFSVVTGHQLNEAVEGDTVRLLLYGKFMVWSCGIRSYFRTSSRLWSGC